MANDSLPKSSRALPNSSNHLPNSSKSRISKKNLFCSICEDLIDTPSIATRNVPRVHTGGAVVLVRGAWKTWW